LLPDFGEWYLVRGRSRYRAVEAIVKLEPLD